MKIAFIIDNPYVIGGGDYAQFKYAQYLARRGHEVLAFGQYRNAFMDQLSSEPGLSLRFWGGLPPTFRGAGRATQYWADAYVRYRVMPTLRRFQPDVLIGYHQRSAVRCVDLGQQLNVPVANVVFESPIWLSRVMGPMFDQANTGAYKEAWAKARAAYQRSDWLLPNSEMTRQEVTDWTGRPVEPAIYAGLEDPAEQPGKGEEGRHILYVGRLDVTKNVHDLIDAMALMSDPPPLVIVGRGNDEHELKARAAEQKVQAEFRGHVSDREKWELMHTCLFLVFPTSFEGFGMPPGEALMCRKPAICSDIPILREIYQDHVEYFPLHQVNALAECMQSLSDRPAYRRERGETGRAYVRSRYTWAHCAERIERALTSPPSG